MSICIVVITGEKLSVCILWLNKSAWQFKQNARFGQFVLLLTKCWRLWLHCYSDAVEGLYMLLWIRAANCLLLLYELNGDCLLALLLNDEDCLLALFPSGEIVTYIYFVILLALLWLVLLGLKFPSWILFTVWLCSVSTTFRLCYCFYTALWNTVEVSAWKFVC